MKTSKAGIAVVERGFTLIEIMVVVVIIGLLAAIVTPKIIGNIDTAAINRAKQEIRTIETAMNLYRLHNLAPNWKPGGYLPRVPIDPWNNPYQYAYPGQRGREFDVYSLGADGQEGGDDVNADIGNWQLN